MLDPRLLEHLTPTELVHLKRALDAQNALESPADYAYAVSGGAFDRPAHVEFLSKTLVDLIEGRLLRADGTAYRRLMVSMPPRHGKSELISKYFPAWFLTRYPDRYVAVTGYEADFARSWGRKARDILANAKPGLAPPLNEKTTAADEWYTKAGGGMFTAGVGGPLTGKGAHALVVDDPVKNFEDARSETKRETAWNWALSTALSRIEPQRMPDGSWGDPGVAILVQTRWHEDDLAGRFLANEPEKWYQIVLPALACDDDPLGRAPGEALWPERYSAEQLAEIKESVGPQIFASLYQQQPFIEGGGLFRVDRARYFVRNRSDKGDFVRFLAPETVDSARDAEQATPPPAATASLGRFGVVDLAASTRTSADFSVFAHFGVTADKNLLLLDSFRARVEGADHMAVLERLHAQWKPRFWGIERATFGLTLLQTAARTGRIPVRELKPDGDKVSRAFAAAALLEAGRLWFPKGAPFLEDWLAELVAFPNGAHDDMVDTLAYSAKILSDRLAAPRSPRKSAPTTLEERIEAHLDQKRKKRRIRPDGW